MFIVVGVMVPLLLIIIAGIGIGIGIGYILYRKHYLKMFQVNETKNVEGGQ